MYKSFSATIGKKLKEDVETTETSESSFSMLDLRKDNETNAQEVTEETKRKQEEQKRKTLEECIQAFTENKEIYTYLQIIMEKINGIAEDKEIQELVIQHEFNRLKGDLRTLLETYAELPLHLQEEKQETIIRSIQSIEETMNHFIRKIENTKLHQFEKNTRLIQKRYDKN